MAEFGFGKDGFALIPSRPQRGPVATEAVNLLLAGLTLRFGLKILSILAMPHGMARRTARGEKGGTSFILPYLEIVLWVPGVGVSFAAGDPIEGVTWKQIAGWGLVAITGSYLHLFVIGGAAGWWLSRRQESACPGR